MVSCYAEAFAKNLNILLKENNLSVYEFSKRVGIPAPTITRYLHCQREIILENLCKIAEFFNEDIDVLIGKNDY